MERFDEEVEKALIFGQDPQERLAELTRVQAVKEVNDPLQLALTQYAANEARTLDHATAHEQERRAYAMVKQAEAHLDRCVAHWNACQTRMWATGEEN